MDPFFAIFGMSMIGVVADICLKLAGTATSKTLETRYFIIGLLIYAATAFGWFFIMRHVKLAALGTLYAMSMIILLSFIGVFIFKEQLRPTEIIGIVLAIISIILLTRFA